MAGDHLRSADGRWVVLEGIVGDLEPAPVHNLRVGFHPTYFIGGDDWGFSVWSHNSCHGNSHATPKPAQGYTILDRSSGDVLKFGETTRGPRRHSKRFLEENNARIEFEPPTTKREAYYWQHEQILKYKETHSGNRPPLNKNDW
jgi:hypothetical protein